MPRKVGLNLQTPIKSQRSFSCFRLGIDWFGGTAGYYPNCSVPKSASMSFVIELGSSWRDGSGMYRGFLFFFRTVPSLCYGLSFRYRRQKYKTGEKNRLARKLTMDPKTPISKCCDSIRVLAAFSGDPVPGRHFHLTGLLRPL